MWYRQHFRSIYDYISMGAGPIQFLAILVFTFIAYSGTVVGIVDQVLIQKEIPVGSYTITSILSVLVLVVLIRRIGQRSFSTRFVNWSGTIVAIFLHIGLSLSLLALGNVIMRGSIGGTIQFAVNNPIRGVAYITVYSLFFVAVLYIQAPHRTQADYDKQRKLLREWIDALEEVEQQEELGSIRAEADKKLIKKSWKLIEELDDAGTQEANKLQEDLQSWVSEYEDRSMPVREKIITGESDKESRRNQHQSLTEIRRQIKSLT